MVGVFYNLVRILPEKSFDSAPSFESLLAEARAEQEENERRKMERQAKLAATKKKKEKLEFQAKAEKLKILAEELGAKVSIPDDAETE